MNEEEKKHKNIESSENLRSRIREELETEDWDVFLTLNFRRYIPLKEGVQLLDRWDSLISRQMVGRRYNLPKNNHRRMTFVGCGGYNGRNQTHFHLLVKLPSDWKTKENISEYQRLVEFYFPKVGGKEVDFRVIGKTTEDRGKVVYYTTNHRHLPLNDDGMLDMDSMVFSRNHGKKF